MTIFSIITAVFITSNRRLAGRLRRYIAMLLGSRRKGERRRRGGRGRREERMDIDKVFIRTWNIKEKKKNKYKPWEI